LFCRNIFRICAAILHLGNIQISSIGEGAFIKEDDVALIQASHLLGIDKSHLRKWIISKQINTRTEKIVTSVKESQAIAGRDSIAKFIYCALFEWIVNAVNSNLEMGSNDNGTKQFIGVLDIYG